MQNMYQRFIKLFFIIIFIAILKDGKCQYELSLSLKKDSLYASEFTICYALEIKNESSVNWGIAGQNYRLFYDSKRLRFNNTRTNSLLPLEDYSALNIVTHVEHLNASGQGNLNFDSDLGFLNLFIDLNNTLEGGVILAPQKSAIVAQLCFDLVNNDLANLCSSVIFAQDELTSAYAPVSNEISVWLSPHITKAGKVVALTNILPGEFGEISLVQPDDCKSFNNGQIVITAPLGYIFSIDHGNSYQSSGVFENLLPDTYHAVVMDPNTACTFDTLVTLINPICNEDCFDEFDNDKDGFIDCMDSDCSCSDEVIVAPNIVSRSAVNVTNRQFYFIANSSKVESIEKWQVFDRWGNLVYQEFGPFINNQSYNWDTTFHGSYVEAGIYIVLIHYSEIGKKETKIIALDLTII